ncbi:class I SAM-dependent methyltransferase [Paenibacillus abyssi]|uniref:Methyltransferase n=1 Tax=Paenibacillus abyssi TaxID=1340531 RepID=A0A917G329_9BACL|nr:class I SAM-dependent methyltransferase [Paenibacillus abyssi]GGG20719.1 methyltransferase [Paenibacillus abyssi]
MGEWYEKSFGTDYMVVYKHRDWENAYREVSNMVGWLKLPAGVPLLDVGCGMGRHALALAGFGYQVTGIDLSGPLLEEAKRKDESKQVRWVQGDMRQLPFAAGEFKATVNLFTSFGYFEKESDNKQVLKQLRRVLAEDGQFLIDYLNPAYVVQHLVPHSQRIDEETGWTIDETRMVDENWVKKEIVIQLAAGEKRHYSERVRLYDRTWFEQGLSEAGLELDVIYGDYDGSAYDELRSKRMIMTGRVRN